MGDKVKLDFHKPFVLFGQEFPPNQRLTLRVSADAITDVGRAEIIRYLLDFGLPILPEDWTWDWMVEKGKFVGTFPKRLSAFYYKEHRLKLDAGVLQHCGNLYAQHANKANDYWFDFDRAIAWNATAFGQGKEGTCYWTSHEQAKDILRAWGGALRFFDGPTEQAVGIARSWIAPNLPYPGTLILFNGYGIQTRDQARILATYFGHEYQTIPLVNKERQDGLLWLNGVKDPVRSTDGGRAGGFIVGPRELLEQASTTFGCPPRTYLRAFDLNWNKPAIEFFCGRCARPIGNDDQGMTRGSIRIHGERYCADCADLVTFRCDHCGERELNDQGAVAHGGEHLCRSCLRDYPECAGCHEHFHSALVTRINDSFYCTDCATERYAFCPDCGRYTLRNEPRCARCGHPTPIRPPAPLERFRFTHAAERDQLIAILQGRPL